MEFRLTYEGEIKSSGSPAHKHEIREKFHPQLKSLWEQHPTLRRRCILSRGHQTNGRQRDSFEST